MKMSHPVPAPLSPSYTLCSCADSRCTHLHHLQARRSPLRPASLLTPLCSPLSADCFAAHPPPRTPPLHDQLQPDADKTPTFHVATSALPLKHSSSQPQAPESSLLLSLLAVNTAQTSLKLPRHLSSLPRLDFCLLFPLSPFMSLNRGPVFTILSYHAV